MNLNCRCSYLAKGLGDAGEMSGGGALGHTGKNPALVDIDNDGRKVKREAPEERYG
jgi:hypothetical protein